MSKLYKSLGIAIETCSNQAFLIIKFTGKISQNITLGFHAPIDSPYLKDSKDDLQKLCKPLRRAIIGLLKMPGIVRVSVRKYQIILEKANLFTWHELEHQIIKNLTDSFFPHAKDFISIGISLEYNPIRKHTDLLMEVPPNSNVHTYHTRTPLINYFYHSLFTTTKKKNITGYGKLGNSIAKRLLDIPGIKEISLSLYEIRIEKKEIHNWKEIDKAIIQALKETAFKEQDEIRIQTYDWASKRRSRAKTIWLKNIKAAS